MVTGSPSLKALVDRYDAEVLDFDLTGDRLRVRLASDTEAWDVVADQRGARLEKPAGRPDARLTADEATWSRIAGKASAGFDAFRSGRLVIRDNLGAGVRFLAATSNAERSERLIFRRARTEVGTIAYVEAGAGRGRPLVLIHGLGATMASFLTTVRAMAPTRRVIALDLPGFGDSDKPLAAPYNPAFFARSVIALLDALELERVDLGGNSMGGRVALQLGFDHAERVGRMALLCPSLAWLRSRPMAPWLRLVRPELGLLQPAPRRLVAATARRLVPGAHEGWVAAGVDEFLRAYCTARGRAAFYASARSIYLESPAGRDGFWTRLPELEPPALFVWGSQDTLVPAAFARHVRRALPSAQHLELPCGHVPQLELPARTHAAMTRFMDGSGSRRTRSRSVSAAA